MALDRIDFDILFQLQRDARMSNKELAAAIGVAPSTCLLRVQRLTESGALRGYHADVDPAALGIALQAMSSVRLSNHAQVSFQKLRSELLQVPEIPQVIQGVVSHDIEGPHDTQVFELQRRHQGGIPLDLKRSIELSQSLQTHQGLEAFVPVKVEGAAASQRLETIQRA